MSQNINFPEMPDFEFPEMPNIEELRASLMTESRMIDHYLIDDGRIWSVKEAKFVDSVPEDGVPGTCPDEEGKNSLKGLIEGLEFYHYPKGELKSDEEYAQEARAKRDQLLDETDYLVVSDYPVSDQKREEIKAYRQLLRDIPAQPGFPRDIEWPVKPVF